jgi:Rrf2 family protein
MAALANEPENTPRSTAHMSEKLHIPLPFLHQIAHTLMQSGLIKATPGPHGGLRLNRDAQEITVLDVVEALEGPIAIAPTNDNGYASNGNPNTAVWDDLQGIITDKLKTFPLQQLANDFFKSEN